MSYRNYHCSFFNGEGKFVHRITVPHFMELSEFVLGIVSPEFTCEYAAHPGDRYPIWFGHLETLPLDFAVIIDIHEHSIIIAIGFCKVHLPVIREGALVVSRITLGAVMAESDFWHQSGV